MQEMHARMTADGQNEMVVGVEPINLGSIKFYGCKKVFLKLYTEKSENGEEATKQAIDESKPPIYDNWSQQLIDIQNTGRLNSQSMLNEINQQRFNSQLMLDNMNLQKMTSQLMLEVNQLKNGGNK